MNAPSPCSYHQNANAVPISRNSSDLAMRLRSSVRCAMSVIVACGSRGARRRRNRDRRWASLTVVLPRTGGSEGAVARAGLLGAGAQLGGAGLRDPRLLVQLRRQVAA